MTWIYLPLCPWWSKSSLTTKDTAGIGYVDDHAPVDGYVYVIVVVHVDVIVVLDGFVSQPSHWNEVCHAISPEGGGK